uniref:NfeD family protein n=1 Tax=Roseivirga sp. TaxID=1964215 RepID=UPI0040483108
MGDWITIILLIITGLILILVEVIFIPGTTIVGIVGFIITCVGIYITYEEHGATAGNYVLAGSGLLSVLGLVYSFRSKSWNKFSLKNINNGKVNEGYSNDLSLEIEGVAISDLKPIGKAEFNNKSYEVKSKGEFITAGNKLKIIQIEGNRIIVESLNN